MSYPTFPLKEKCFCEAQARVRRGSGKGWQGMAVKAKGLKAYKPLPRATLKLVVSYQREHMGIFCDCAKSSHLTKLGPTMSLSVYFSSNM